MTGSRTRTALLLAILGLVLLVAPASALARTATLVSVTGEPGENHPTSTWSLPSGAWSEFIETATSDEVGVGGHFLQKNLKTFNVVGQADTKFTDEYEFGPGRYYVHVGTHDTVRTSDTPLIEYSNVFCFRVVAGPSIASCLNPPGGGGGGGGGGGVKDKTAPVTSLSFPKVQDIDKLYVKVHTSEAARIKATGTISVGGASKVYRFKPASLSLSGNASTKVRLKLAKKNLRAVKRALKKKRLKAKITVTATDAAGNRRSKKATLKLKD